MLAWKFLAAGAVAPFTGVRWPSPSGSTHAPWVEGAPGHGKGVHACAVDDLPYWFDDELWEVELAGQVTRSGRQLVAPRGRLVGRVEAWPAAQEAFTLGCVERTRRRVLDGLLRAGRADDAEQIAAEHDLDAQRDAAFAIAATGPAFAGYLFDALRRRPYPGLCAYIAANAAAALDGCRGHDDERQTQVRWLADHLALVAAAEGGLGAAQ
jgi:hypothetical protein